MCHSQLTLTPGVSCCVLFRPCQLEVGNGGMTYDEYVAHFSLWCLIKAPLLIGCDVTNLSNDTLHILTNQELIAINQDPLGVQGHRVWRDQAGHEVWAGPLANDDVVVVLFNRNETAANITAQWSDIGVPSGTSAAVRDLWLFAGLGDFTDQITLPVVHHGSRALRLTPSDGKRKGGQLKQLVTELRAERV